MKPSNKNRTAIRKTAPAVAIALLTNPAWAGPSNYVHLPTVEYGETEIELHFGHQEDNTSTSAAKLGVAISPAPWWKTELLAEYERAQGGTIALESLEWENIFTLTEPGEYAIDSALFIEIEDAASATGGWKLKVGPLLQTEFGRTQLNFNPILSRKFSTGTAQNTELNYEAQIKYRYKPALEFGAQALGNLGKWNDWASGSAQTHNLGPAIFGKLPVGEHRAIKYDLALLLGVNKNAPDTILRGTVEYEF